MSVACRRCPRSFRFVALGSGSAMPTDLIPDDEGNVAAKLVGGTWVGRVLKAGERTLPDELRFTSHFATCGKP